jgi:quinol monooxygenase YgiN
MSNPTIRVVARIIAFPEQVEQVKVILTGLIETTRGESGCIQYELLQNQTDLTDFTFVEEWRSGRELDTHLGNTHIQTAIEQLDGLLAAPPDIRRYDKIG